MKLDEKRKVIEVLLCTAQHPWRGIPIETTWDTSRAMGYAPVGVPHDSVQIIAGDAWRAAYETTTGTHGDRCIEAAYRLIESSPTLIREWFGTP